MTFRSKREATETLGTQVLKMLKKKKFLVGNYDYEDQTIEEYLPENAAFIFCENNHIDVELRKNGGEKYVSVIDSQPDYFENEETVFRAYCDEKSGKLEIVEYSTSNVNDMSVGQPNIFYRKEPRDRSVTQIFKVWHVDCRELHLEAEYAEKAAYIYCDFFKLYEKIWSGNPEEYITVVAENGDKTIFRLAFDRWACGEVLTKLPDPRNDTY